MGQQAVAVVDDDPSVRETLLGFLEANDFRAFGAGDATGLEAVMRREPIDLVLLDIRLPGRDGLSLARDLRQKSDVGIILITARGDKVDRILGLEYGADDYVAKPIDERELLPRVRNLLWRMGRSSDRPAGAVLPVGEHRLSLDRRALVDASGADIPLTTAEFELLAVLARNAGRAMTRLQLIQAASRRRADPQDRTVDTLVRRIRRKIERDPDEPQILVTVHGTGYMLRR